ncbi:MAG: DEAD/DEAH box helicase family protein [Betaproteobacteria bacterium]|nr:DEAD/DEAH box helicase family protein [Betaproteobacteria bacterium]
MFELKDYQQKALAALDAFFFKWRTAGLDAAWQHCAPVREKDGQSGQAPYDKSALGEVPAVCVRIPTGGGKTFLAAHAIAKAGGRLRDTAAPVSLWLVPSDAIRGQTLAALNTPRNPCREALSEHFGELVRVCALEDLATVGPQEAGSAAIIIVATIQSFNVKDKTIRAVYDFDEALAPHFHGLTPQQEAPLDRVTGADIAKQTYLSAADIGRVKASLANWLKLHRPIVVVDEAHNNRTEQAFRMLRNLYPACLIELTATPVADSNVIFHVGAQALAREEMIKLPIVLMEHKTGWKDAVRDAILTRDRLETLAAREADYIRPVLLFQAEDVNGEANVETLLAHLTNADGERLDRRQIAVATGDQKELDGLVLAEPACPIRYVITVKALKEGWDCPFAYVLCSLQDMKSGKDVEQLLGRVLRMPYARPRQQAELGKAYAHVVSTTTARAADALADRLVNNMGFERYEAQAAIAAPDMFPPLAGGGRQAPLPAEAVFSLPVAPAQAIPEALKDRLEIRPTSAGATVIVRGELSVEVEDFLLAACKLGKQQEGVKEAIERARARQEAQQAPATRGALFAPLPQLCLEWDGELQPVERRVLAELGEFDLFALAVSLPGFAVRESSAAFEIDVDGDKVVYGAADSGQLHLNEVNAHASEHDLVRWLDRECRQIDIGQAVLLKWLLAVLHHLIADRGLSLTALVRGKYLLAEAVRREIDRRRQLAVNAGFQKALPGFTAAPVLADSFRYAFAFRPNQYPARPPFYAGRFRFKKHYYPVIHDLREKRADGTPAEEFVCARAIDALPAVKHWVRNVEREERFSFWLPTATDYFYPDFVAELNDGRVLVVEYKGAHLLHDPDTREKDQIGRQWAAASGGRCLFLMAVADDKGRDVAGQIADRIAGSSGGMAGDPHG